MSTLVTFGDSWPAGAELREGEQPFGYHMQQMLGFDSFKNKSEQATSIEHMLLQLHEFINSSDYTGEPTTAIFFITEVSRSLYFDSDQPKEIQIDRANREAESKAYYKYLYSDELAHFRFSTAILALQQMCQTFNINDYYLLGWSSLNYQQCLSGINWDKFYKQGQKSIVETVFDPMFNESPQHLDFLVVPDMQPYFYEIHPNELGHKMIAEELVRWISSLA